MPLTKKRRVVYVLMALLPLGMGLAFWAFLIEPNRLVVRQQTIAIPNWRPKANGLRIAAVSDIHAGSPFIDEEKLRRLVALINDSKPDLVVLLGDFMITERFYKQQLEPEAIAAQLRALNVPLGVYAVLGNHDWWYDGAKVRRALEGAGIKVLDNEVVRLDVRDEPVWLAGLADAWTRPQDITGTLSKVSPGEPVIVLTHNPDIFPAIPQSVSLTLAGHTHGGQVCLPLVGRLVVPSQYGQRYAAGLVIEKEKNLFVTTGVGTSVLPLRFLVAPEIVILTINSTS